MTDRSSLSRFALTFDEVAATGEEGIDVVVLRLNSGKQLRPVGFGRLGKLMPGSGTIRAVRTQLSYRCAYEAYESSSMVTSHDAEYMGLLPLDSFHWDRMDKEYLALNGVTCDSGMYWSNCCVVRRADAPKACGCSSEELELMLSEIAREREYPA
jgi:hypothetical protein